MADLIITGTKTSIGLGSVDNTSDVNKPVSTAQATAIAIVMTALTTHAARTDNPHSVTKSQVGLGNADNTSDADKPISTLQQAALDLKQSISGLLSAVFGLVFSGFSAGANSSIVDGITVGTAFARIQGQINARPNESSTTIATIIDNSAPATPNDTDSVATTSSGSVNRITWTNVKAFLKTYFDTLYITATSTSTLTNKRITARTGTTTSSATPTINTDNVDFYSITALAVAITSFTTNLSGIPTEGQSLWIAITDNGTARAMTWGASFEASTVALPTTTVISTRLDVGFMWNSVTSKWRCVGVA